MKDEERQNVTGNSKGEIVPGSKVIYNDRIYDVGEVEDGRAHLYLNNKSVGWLPSSIITVI